MPTAATARSACSRDTLVTGYKLRRIAPRLAWSSRLGAVTRPSSSSSASGKRPRSYASEQRLFIVGFMRALRDLGASLDAVLNFPMYISEKLYFRGAFLGGKSFLTGYYVLD